MPALIKEIRDNSIADELDIKAGDLLLSINEHIVKDMLDYEFYSQDDFIVVDVQKENGEIWSLEIEKDYDEDLGFIFDGFIFDRMRTCKNRCAFCFIDQLPRHLRKTLYVKDDDYRFSFMYGNFITLSNLSEEDWQKIEQMHLSPLYVSVHCMRAELRAKLINNPRGITIKEDLQRLKNAGIEVHTQIVLCPDLNDGDVLRESIEELAQFYPSVQSIGIVPVGLTGHREKLWKLRPVESQDAEAVIEMLEPYNSKFRMDWGKGFVYLADEFYLRAQIDLPADEYYDDYCQIENGIGISRLLLDEFAELEDELPHRISERSFSLLTGVSAVPVLRMIVERLNRIKGLHIDIIPVENHFFGGGVTVTGLLTGRDIINRLGKSFAGKNVILPEIIFRDGKDVLLDDLSLEDIKKASGANIRTVDGSARDLVELIISN